MRGRAAPGADLTPLAQQGLGDHERRRIPTEDFTRTCDFLFAGCIAMSLLGASLGRETEPDDGLAGDHGRLVGHGAGGGDRVANRIGIVAVDLLDVPARRAKTREFVVGDRKAGRTVDRDRVVIQKAIRWPSW